MGSQTARMLKNAHLSRASRACSRPAHPLAGVARVAPYSSRRPPARSPTRGRGKSRSLFVATPSGPLTHSRAWQKSLLIRRDALRPAHPLAGVAKVAPYSSRRPPARSPTRGRGKSRSLFVATPPLDGAARILILSKLRSDQGRSDRFLKRMGHNSLAF